MLRFFGVVFILALLVGGWGYARGWFSVTKTQSDDSTNITFGLDKDKARRDLQSSQAEFDETLRKVDAKLADLRQRAKSAAADSKTALDRQVAEFESERDDISRKLEEFKTASRERMKQLKDDINAGLDRMRAALDRALESK